MAQRGRPTSITAILEGLKASPVAKDRLLVIFENLAGLRPLSSACHHLRMSPTLFRRYRRAVLELGLAAVEPRPRGRPVRVIPKHARQATALQERIARLEEELVLARVREELALVLPLAARVQKKRRAARPARPAVGPSRPPCGSDAAATLGPGPPGSSG